MPNDVITTGINANDIPAAFAAVPNPTLEYPLATVFIESANI